MTRLFHNDDLVTQSKCAVRKLKGKCPLLSRHMYGLNDQHQVPNVPCDRADQNVFLFHHLTYFHKLNAKSATKLIRALILNKDPSEILFHYNETIVAMNQQVKRTKKLTDNHHQQQQQQQQQPKQEPYTYSNQFENFSSKVITVKRTTTKQHFFLFFYFSINAFLTR